MQDLFRVQNNLMDNTGLILSVMKSGPKKRYGTVPKTQKDSYTPSNTQDGKDDGKISFKEKLKNFGKGLIAPVKTMFSSPKNIALTALSVAGGAALIALTGGAAAPLFVAAGAAAGAIQIGKGIYKQATAKTDEQARKAWQGMGSGTFTLGVSALGAKSALKASGVENAKNMNIFQALGKCIKDTPKNISAGLKNISVKMPKLSGIFAGLKEKLPKWGKKVTNAEPSQTPVADERLALPLHDDAPVKVSTEPKLLEQKPIETPKALPETKTVPAENVPANSQKIPRLDRSVIEKDNKYILSYDDVLETQKRAINNKSAETLAEPNKSGLDIISTDDKPLLPDVIEDSNGHVIARRKGNLLNLIKNFFKLFGFGVSDK